MTARQWLSIIEVDRLTEEERRIVSLLADGKTQPEIAAILGLHRSAVWRRIAKLRKRTRGGER